MPGAFDGFDMSEFWKPSEYARREYVGEPLTDSAVRVVERELGYRLPPSYIEFMRFQNGGIPRRTNHRTRGTDLVVARPHRDHRPLFGRRRPPLLPTR